MPVDLTEIITARAALLAAKRTALTDAGFSSDQALQIILADIQAGLAETGRPMTPDLADGSDLVAPPDLSELLGRWEFQPDLIFEFSRTTSIGSLTRFRSSSINFEFVGSGQEQMEIVFFFNGNVVGRTVGAIVTEGYGNYEFLGSFQNQVLREVGLRISGSFGSGNFGANFSFSPPQNEFAIRYPDFPRVLTRP